MAQESSARLGHGYVGSEHLLLGLVREGRGMAAQILMDRRLNPDTILSAIADMVGVGAPDSQPTQGLTPRCRRVIERATEEARRLERRTVDTEHLLLGLLREEDSMAARILAAAGVQPAAYVGRHEHNLPVARLVVDVYAQRHDGAPLRVQHESLLVRLDRVAHRENLKNIFPCEYKHRIRSFGCGF